MLLQEILYGLQYAYTSLFGLAGLNGLPPEELEKISSQAREQSIKYIANLETRIAQTRQKVSAVQGTK